jgi:two-component system sensor kinase FixL
MALNSFARLPLPELRAVELPPLIQEVLESNPVPANIRVALDFPPDLAPVLGDRSQLLIVFGNLVRNARDAMPAGGELKISTGFDADHVEISVKDTGSGISPENQSRIMEPLYTTKSRGIGLGLPITKAIIEKHHGRLKVTSQPSQGACFTVQLSKAMPEAS